MDLLKLHELPSIETTTIDEDQAKVKTRLLKRCWAPRTNRTLPRDIGPT